VFNFLRDCDENQCKTCYKGNACDLLVALGTHSFLLNKKYPITAEGFPMIEDISHLHGAFVTIPPMLSITVISSLVTFSS